MVETCEVDQKTPESGAGWRSSSQWSVLSPFLFSSDPLHEWHQEEMHNSSVRRDGRGVKKRKRRRRRRCSRWKARRKEFKCSSAFASSTSSSLDSNSSISTCLLPEKDSRKWVVSYRIITVQMCEISWRREWHLKKREKDLTFVLIWDEQQSSVYFTALIRDIFEPVAVCDKQLAAFLIDVLDLQIQIISLCSSCRDRLICQWVK